MEFTSSKTPEIIDRYRNTKGLPPLKETPKLANYYSHAVVQSVIGLAGFCPEFLLRPHQSFDPLSVRLTLSESQKIMSEKPYLIPTSSVCKHALLSDVPLIHVTENLASAFSETDPSPEKEDYHIPYPAFVLNLPRGLVKDANNSSYSFILVSYVPDFLRWWWSTDFTQNLLWNPEPAEAILSIIGFADSGELYYTGIPLEFPLDYCRKIEPQSNSNIARIALNALLSMNHAPELLQEESVPLTRSKGFKKKPGKFATIRWLGRNYKRQKLTVQTRTQSKGGVYRPHWRKGHWHTIRYGEKHQQSRLQWFQPKYVNAAYADTVIKH